ncbi:MAG: hemerythrin domain-containing protein [Myxococcota bacterium]
MSHAANFAVTHDILTMLSADHARVKGILEALEHTTTSAAKTRAERILEIEHELHVHMDFEETTLYPALEEAANKEQRAAVSRAFVEHEEAEAVLAELCAMDPADERWKGLLARLSADVLRHAEEEEGPSGLFAMARALIGPRRLAAMAARYNEVKALARVARSGLAAPRGLAAGGLRLASRSPTETVPTPHAPVAGDAGRPSVAAAEAKARSARIHFFVVRT